MATIASIHAIEVLDSRGNPTLQVSVMTDTRSIGVASVPSGASTGEKEAVELRDKDNSRYQGKGVLQAIAHVEGPLQDLLKGRSVEDQKGIDEAMICADGTENKSHFGANAILGVSLAVARAAAVEKKVPLYQSIVGNQEGYILPCPMMNILNGGAHADNALDIQEFMIRPRGAPSFVEAVRWGAEVFHVLKAIVREMGQSTTVGDEGGLAPSLSSAEQALDWILLAIERAGFVPGKDISIALDFAASWFYDKGSASYIEKKKKLLGKSSDHWDRDVQVARLYHLSSHYPIDSIEDGMAEDDVEGWQQLTEKLGKHVQIVGDDIFVTNQKLFQEGVKKGIANAILIKPNQIGTLTETLDCIACAKQYGYQTIISHRSGETEDAFIADLCVATGAGQIKTGSLSRSDRLAKYNRLLTIAQELKEKAIFKDANPYRGLL